jgi:hypothetical protein
MRGKKHFIVLVLLTSLLAGFMPIPSAVGQAEIKPSNPKGWGMFFGTSGDVRIEITDPGVAVRIEVPREFLQGTAENYTSFIESNISNDYFYYYLFDQSEYYPYDTNAPYTIEIWNPPRYLNPDCTGLFYNFTAPKFVLLHGNRYRDGQWIAGLTAPSIAGIYNFTVRIAISMGPDGKPVFPVLPDKVLQVPVSMREDPASIIGYISETDRYGRGIIRTKGVVYAIGVSSGRISRAYVDPDTGFFNITGLYEGEYSLEGSAGFFPETGYAYAITEFPTTVHVGRGHTTTLLSTFALERGCIINGSITYVDAFNTANSIAPLNSPYLNALGYKGLNYTVEAYDEQGRIVASRTYRSNNIPTERYALLFRNGTVYVGYPALGTEYAGFGTGAYTVKIWVYGFTLPQSQVKTATFADYGDMIDVGESRLPYGGVVSGTIRLFHGLVSETPKEGELETYGSASGENFGGNILVEMYRNDGVLKGLAVYNRTFANGVVSYADFSTGDQTPLLKFYILGFTEHYNNSYSGRWEIGSYPGPSPWDYGLETGTYYIRVWTRGYVQEAVEDFNLGAASNQTVTIDLQRGGAVQVRVESWDTWAHTRRPQAVQSWRFLDFLCPAPRLRVYFYSSSGVEIGYTESILRVDFPGVTETTATLNFTGHNWSIFQIIFRGYVPTALDAGTYAAKAYTYGYIQPHDVSFYLSLGDMTRFGWELFIAGEIHGSVPLEMNGLFVSLTENATVRPEVLLDGTLQGVDVVNATKDSSLFDFSTAGFYGRGHFFYVDPDGARWMDYGFDIGNYTVFVPEFGFDRMFMQNLNIYANVPDLNTMVGVVFHIERMVKIFGTISGEDQYGVPVPLVWASAGWDTRIAYSYDGDFMLHVANGMGPYTVTFTCPGYNDYLETVTTDNQIGVTVVLTQSGAPFS